MLSRIFWRFWLFLALYHRLESCNNKKHEHTHGCRWMHRLRGLQGCILQVHKATPIHMDHGPEQTSMLLYAEADTRVHDQVHTFLKMTSCNPTHPFLPPKSSGAAEPYFLPLISVSPLRILLVFLTNFHLPTLFFSSSTHTAYLKYSFCTLNSQPRLQDSHPGFFVGGHCRGENLLPWKNPTSLFGAPWSQVLRKWRKWGQDSWLEQLC